METTEENNGQTCQTGVPHKGEVPEGTHEVERRIEDGEDGVAKQSDHTQGVIEGKTPKELLRVATTVIKDMREFAVDKSTKLSMARQVQIMRMIDELDAIFVEINLQMAVATERQDILSDIKGLLENKAAAAPIVESVAVTNKQENKKEQHRSTLPEDKEWTEVRAKKRAKNKGSGAPPTKSTEHETEKHKKKEEEGKAKKLTYSSVIKRAAKQTRVSNDKVVLLYPREGADLKKEEMIRKIKPVENKLHINAVRQTRGGGLLVLTNDAESADVIRKAMTESAQVKNPGYNTEPRVLIYDVPKSMKPDEIQQSVHAQNTFEGVTHEDFKRLFKPLRVCPKKRDRNHDTNNWIVAVSGEIRNNLIKSGHVYILDRRCKVRDYVPLTVCYKCCRLGHLARTCKMEETCKHCGKIGHKYKKCPTRGDPPTCINCREAKRPSNHAVGSRNCPELKAALLRSARHVGNVAC
ncbi:hypothetical protein AAG570_004877 [Ranatra chinensis]|uniref:CCHC-type domain-containing protein n=1 Tax=Ranatra chinensis TaxID=642074 RepID=A0ABD0YBJ6_9HEMI